MNPRRDFKQPLEESHDETHEMINHDSPSRDVTIDTPATALDRSLASSIEPAGTAVLDSQLDSDLDMSIDGGVSDLGEFSEATPLSQRRYMSEHTTCAMCDTKLEIRHEINMNDLKVKEEAHCPSCGIRVRSRHHLMH